MSVGSVKPGRYQPKCKKCGKPFILQVGEGDPPKFAVAKVKAAPTSPVTSPAPLTAPASVAPVVPRQPAAPMLAGSAAPVKTAGSTAAVRVPMTTTAGHAPDATMASAPGVHSSGRGEIDATMDGSVVAASVADATMDSSAVTSGSSLAAKSVVRPRQSSTATAVDATMAGGATMEGAAGETRQKSSGGVRKGGTRVSGSGDLSGDSSMIPADQNVGVGDVPEKLGGYRILRLLGRGAMGAVYEAKQVSLDRNVALKTIRGRLADSPSALARFTREAYAAAQLVHHNVVQIYDFGQDGGQHFFSMEWVRGGPLSDLIRDKGPLDPRVAATYALQAARGLQFAHRHGMVHRDVKPANLLLNDEGVVKVADLGLVKVPDQPDPESDVGAASATSGMASGTQVTMMGTAVGTPAYMAPEQGVDATTVDHRADVYSLGCSLFFLLTGKAPFGGSQVSEVMRQHVESAIPKAQQTNPRVPEQLDRIIQRSMAKRPEDRYASLADMIVDLEGFLGLQSGQVFSPSHQQADRWEELAKTFAAVPQAKLQKPAILGASGLAALLLLLTPLFGFRFILMAPAFLFASFAVAFALGSSGGRSVVVTRLRNWLGSLSWFDYIVGVLVGSVTLLISFLVGMLPGLLVGASLGSVAGAAYHFLLLVPLRKSRESIALEAEKFVRDLRIEGVDEDKLRDFAARYSGRNWKPLFEELFGYDATIAVRDQLLGDPSAKANAGGRTIRDWVCTSLQAKTDSNRIARDHSRLATLEEKGLQSEGMTAAEAKERAWQMASAMIDAAKLQAAPSVATSDPKQEADKRRNQMKAMLADARSGKYAKKRDKLAVLRLAFSGKARLLVGCGLLVMAGLWAHQNNVVSAETLQSIRDTAASGAIDVDALRDSVQQGIVTASQKTDVPNLLGTSGWAVGFAGLLVACSSFVTGWRMSLFAIPAAVIAIFGASFGIPAVGPIPAWVIACAGACVLMIPGVWFGESGEATY